MADALMRILGGAVAWFFSLIAAGKTPEEAEEIINIESRRSEYEAGKAEDEQALRDKHGVSDG